MIACLSGRRRVFTSVPNLLRPSPPGPNTGATTPTSFIWKATAEDIITKVKRGRETLHQIKRRQTTSGSCLKWPELECFPDT